MMLDTRPSPWAVVVDDRDDDAIGIMNALSLLGIPAVRYDGDAVMPDAPLRHVRILFLDLELGSGTPDMKRTAGAVFQILPPSATGGPCLIVLWTAHEDDDREEFRRQFDKYNEALDSSERISPWDVIALDKKQFWTGETEAAVKTKTGTGEQPIEVGQKASDRGVRHYLHVPLKTRLNEALAPYKSLAVLLRWEAINGHAAAKTAAGLFHASKFTNATTSGTNEHEQALQAMYQYLAGAALGKNAQNCNEEEISKGAFEIMAVLQADMVQRLASGAEDAYPMYSTATLGADAQIAALNTVLLTSAEGDPCQPGAVLRAAEAPLDGAPFKASPDDESYRKFLGCIFKDAFQKRETDIVETSIPVFVEVTPGCDYAQNKRRMLRFIPGILFPADSKKLLPKQAEHLRKVGPLLYGEKAMMLVLDTQHFFTLPITAGLPEAMFRLRDHVRTDIQAWLGGQLARPGHVSLDMHGS